MATGNKPQAQETIDLRQELVDLYARERLLAFFEFTLERPGNEPLPGLCRIARPQRQRAALRYLSLSFLVDIPDTATRPVVKEALSALEGDALKTAVPEVTDVVSAPSLTVSPESYSYLTQLDLLLKSEVDKPFILTKLIPAIARLTQLQTTHIEWWEESPPPETAPIPSSVVLPSQNPSLLEMVRGWLRRPR